RWRRPAAQSLAPIIPLHRARLRRCRLRWRARRRSHLGRNRDRAQGRRSNRLRRPAATLGRRALLRLDRAQQATGEGLRSHNSLRQSLPLRRLGHAPRASPRTIGMSFKTDSDEARVPMNHPLRKIRKLVRDVLGELNRSLSRIYASEGRPSIPPEQLLSVLLLQVFYGIRSERQLMEQLDYNLLYRWFVGLSPDDPV